MCGFASFVLTRDRVFSLPDSESHSEIIRRHEIHESGVRGLNVVKVELLPPESGVIDPDRLEGWTVKFDQDEFPEWHESARSEERARGALREKLVNLRTLDASHTHIADVSKLVNLTWLSAADSQITDVSKLVNLTTLLASNSRIADVSKLVKLEWLGASNSRIADVSKLVNLTWLDASYSQIADVSKLVNLEWLDARHSKIKDEDLARLTKRGCLVHG